MPTGIIKWFNNTKGWGFIVPTDGKSEIFVHFSSILSKGYKKLFSGQEVSYSTQVRQQGEYAVDVIPHLHIKKKESDHQ